MIVDILERVGQRKQRPATDCDAEKRPTHGLRDLPGGAADDVHRLVRQQPLIEQLQPIAAPANRLYAS